MMVFMKEKVRIGKEKIEENFNVFDFELNSEDMGKISELDKQGKFIFKP